MRTVLIGTKLGNTSYSKDDGTLIPVTLIKVDDCLVSGIKTKEKKLTNMRSSTSEATVTLRAVKKLSLDQCIEFISEDELLEITPQNIRLRKRELDVNKRHSLRKKNKEN